MKTLRAEFHVHTVLSPCAELEMLPPLIIQEALDRDIQILAITDHNASGNIEAVQKAALDTGITVLPGMELQTREEVHVLCLFDTLDQIRALQSLVNSSLPDLQNDAEHFGDQLFIDENGDFVARETRLLLVSTDLTLEDACASVASLEGLCIPAHVNRKANGLLPNLGFVPEGLPVDALEISRHLSPRTAVDEYPQLRGYPLLQGGDAHRLEELLGANQFTIELPTIGEIKHALRSEDERSFRILSSRMA